MKKYFKALMLLLLCVFAFTATSCGGTTDKPDDKTETPTQGDDTPTTGDDTPTSGDDTPVEAIDVSKVKFYSGIFTYDGKPHSIEVSKHNLPEGVTVTYENNNQTEVGVYTVTATLKDSKENVLATLTAKLTINKENKDVSKVSFENASYNWKKDSEYELTATNIPEGVYATYDNNKRSEVGSQEATVKLYDEFDNELLATLTATLTIKYEALHDEAVFASGSYIADGSTVYTLSIPEDVASTFTNVEYNNNSSSTQGVYYSTALVTLENGEKQEYHAILTIDNPENKAFNTYADEMFVYFLSGDQSTLNIFMVDYESFGFEHQDATWYTYEKYSAESYASDQEEVSRLQQEFAEYDYATLSFSQQYTYKKIKEEINSYVFMLSKLEYLLMQQSYIDEYGGYAADLPTTLEAYVIRTKQDAEDLISYVDSVYDALMSYVDYAKDRAEAGYELTDFTIKNMVNYLDGVSQVNVPEDEKTEYYLIAILENKIKESKTTLSLTDEEVQDYLTRLDKAFVKFLKGHEDLAKELVKYYGKADSNKQYYLSSYGQDGKDLYEHLLRSRLGIDMPMEEYIAFIEATTTKYSNLYSSYSSTSKSEAIMDGKVKIIDSTDPKDIINYLKEFAKTIVPDLASTPEIDVTYMDDTTTENTTTLAYYMKSPLDSYTNEYIHLNGKALGDDYLETIKTLAHEGYPGHLYAYVSTKENASLSNLVRVSTCTGHGEGWAKYVEIALCDYIAKTKGTADWKIAMEQTKYWDLFVYNLYTRIDVGINYQGWGPSEVLKYMKSKNLVFDMDAAEELTRSLVEAPGQYAAYGYGQSLFFELHEEAREVLGENYNEVEFNAMLLEHGWVGLSQLQEYYNEYMTKKCFLLGIDWK